MLKIVKQYIPLWSCCGMCFVVEHPIAAMQVSTTEDTTEESLDLTL